MAQFNSGIKFDSDVTANNTTPSSATFAVLRGNLADGSDATTNDGDFLATQAGAMVLSLRPDPQSSAKPVSLIEGKFVDVSMEYSNDGASVRFLIKAEGSTTVPTAYVAAGAGHTLALSYASVPPASTSLLRGSRKTLTDRPSGLHPVAN